MLPVVNASASWDGDTTSDNMPAPPTAPSRGSSVTARRAGLPKRSTWTAAGKPIPGRATKSPRDSASRSARDCAADGKSAGVVTQVVS